MGFGGSLIFVTCWRLKVLAFVSLKLIVFLSSFLSGVHQLQSLTHQIGRLPDQVLMDLIHIFPSGRPWLEVDWMNLLMQAHQIFPLSVEQVGNNYYSCEWRCGRTDVVLPNSSKAT